jgi:uncharacterized protein YrrD
VSVERFSQAPGRPVVAADTAESIGSVKHLVLARDGRRIEAVHIEGRGSRAVVIGWDAVEAFGVDAVIASSGSDSTGVDSDRERDAARGDVAMIGARVLTADGAVIGAVDDVEFDTETGEVKNVLTDRGPIEPERLRALGSYALVVDPAAAAP